MKTILPVIFPLAILLSSAANFKKERIVFFGDSITEAGIKPGGYIDVIQKNLTEKNKQTQYELIGAGISGNKVYDLYLRLKPDVLDKNPTTVVIYIGINDVWHKASTKTGTDLHKYEKFYKAIISELQAKKVKVFICTPTVIGEKKNLQNTLDGELNQFANVVRKIAAETNTGLIDLQKSFLNYLEENNPSNADKGVLTTDQVHLNLAGNNLVAQEIMKALKL